MTAKGRVLVDATILIRPTHTFAVEQIKTNVHENRLDTAVETVEGQLQMEPRREDYVRLIDYEDAKKSFQSGRSLKSK